MCKSSILAFLAALFVFVMYAQSAWHHEFVYDDHEVIENQFPIRSFADLAEIFREPHYLNFPYYRPITRATLAIQRTISGDNPLPFHIFNAALAGILLLAMYLLLLRPGFALPAPAALLASLWLAVHPALSECVYPAASGRETLLPALMIVLAVWAYLRPDLPGYGLALLFLILGLLCKEQAAVTPGIFFLADILGISRRKRWLRGYVPIVLIFIGYYFLRRAIFGGPTLHLDIQHDWSAPAMSMLYGLQTAFAPFLNLHYEPARDVWLDFRLAGIALVALGLLIIFVGKASRPVKFAAIFWLGWFILLQLPTAHIFLQEAAYSERYAALAILAVPATLGAVAAERLRNFPLRFTAVAASLMWAGVLGWISWFVRASTYINDRSFSIQWVNSDPNAAGAHRGLGYLAQENHEYNLAILQYQRTLKLDPNDRSARNNLANLLADREDYIDAQKQYESLLRRDPNDVDVLINYGNMLGEFAVKNHGLRARDKALQLLQAALALRPRNAKVHFALGLYYQAFGPLEKSADEYRQALALNPGWKDAQDRLDAVIAAQTSATRPSTSTSK